MEKLKKSELDDKLNSSEYVILDFSSPGCAPCRKVPPVIEAIIDEMDGVDVAAYEIDVSEDTEIAQKYFVLGVPTLVIFRNGQEIKRFNSVPGKEKIKEVLG